jgi:protein ImuB
MASAPRSAPRAGIDGVAVRTLVVCCRDWPVLALDPPVVGDPVAVVHANRVVSASPAARAEGVDVGQRRREAQGRCPGLVVVDHDADRDARAFEVVAAAVETFTPRIELSQPGVCALPTRGPSRYFGGDEVLVARVRDEVDAALADRTNPGGTSPGATSVGVADGPFAAGLAAEVAAGRPTSTLVVAPGATPAFLAPLPVATLAAGLARAGVPDGRSTDDLVDVLMRLGLRTLGDLAAVPAADVVARFGLEGQLAHRLARGLDERPPDTRIPPPHLQVEAALDPPATRVDTAAFVAKSLADDLHARLEHLGLACTRVAVRAETEHGESIERLWRHEGALSPAAIADRVRWQLDGWLNAAAASRPTSGITLLVLAPDEVTAASGRQLGFWGGEAESDERAARALARLAGLLGPDAVTVPEWRGGRSPSDQIVRVAAHAVDLSRHDIRPAVASRAAPWPGRVPSPSPATVHAEPLACEVVDRQGSVVSVDARGAASAAPARLSVRGGPWVDLTGWAGPWPTDERWWDPPAHRRRARFQVVDGDGRAHLLAVERGGWWVEATYD